MISNDYWNLFRDTFNNYHLSYKNEGGKTVHTDFLTTDEYDICEYYDVLHKIITGFKREIETNILHIPNTETKNDYVLNLYEKINTELNSKSGTLNLLDQNKKLNEKEIRRRQLISIQIDSLFGLTFWFKADILFRKILKDHFTKIHLQNEHIASTFDWKGKNKEQQLQQLFNELIKKRIIAKETNPDDFKIAFNNVRLTTPLKIKWLVLSKNKLSSKSSLFHFIDLLVKKGFIDFLDNTVLYDKLKLIFSDANGKAFDNFRQSNSSRSETPSRAADIEEAVKSITA